ncbi:MAG: amino acid ABC transporter permease [Deltaproteobacteria bacterium]|nr:amino acid ABC transporter permease [Deltaproteobacteria bacterium]
MDTSFISQSLPLFAKATWLTLVLSFFGVVFSIVVGTFCAIINFYKIPVLRRIVYAYIEVARNTPLIVQLFFLYYALPRLGMVLDGKTCAVVGLTFLGGAYMAEAIRSGLQSVGRTQIETGMSLGFGKIKLMRYIIIPQALAVALPVISATTIFLMKETSVVSIVALHDLLYVAKDLLKEGHALQSNLMLVVCYLILILPVSLGFSYLERRSRFAGFGA